MSQQQYQAITKSDSTTYTPPLTSLYVGVTGDVAIVGNNDAASVVLKAMAAGIWHHLPFPVSQILATGTTATNMVAVAGY